MNGYNNNYRIWLKIVSTVVLCLFVVNSVSRAMPAKDIPGDRAGLQVQSILWKAGYVPINFPEEGENE